jgi:streptomycin 6-kinase
MSDLTIPVKLAVAVAREKGRRDAWVNDLPSTIAGLADRWELQVMAPYEPGGECAWVAPARNTAGDDLVLKVGWAHDEGEHEADGLRAWSGQGTVLLLADHREGNTNALLLERCRPGTELGRSLPEEQQDEIVAGLLQRLWLEPGTGHPFRPLQQMCDAWADEHLADPRPPDLDAGLDREGVALFRSLPADADREVLLLTDLHAANILAAEREPWLVIDPKPYVGDPHYDPIQHLLNCQERLTADPHGLADRMADLCEIDRERFRLWLFARCVIESSWWPGMAEVATKLAP